MVKQKNTFSDKWKDIRIEKEVAKRLKIYQIKNDFALLSSAVEDLLNKAGEPQ